MSPDLSIVKRLGGTDATKIDVFLFITKDFTKKVCCKFTGLDVYRFRCLQVDEFTSSQVHKLRAKHITRLLVHLSTRSLFLKHTCFWFIIFVSLQRKIINT